MSKKKQNQILSFKEPLTPGAEGFFEAILKASREIKPTMLNSFADIDSFTEFDKEDNPRPARLFHPEQTTLSTPPTLLLSGDRQNLPHINIGEGIDIPRAARDNIANCGPRPGSIGLIGAYRHFRDPVAPFHYSTDSRDYDVPIALAKALSELSPAHLPTKFVHAGPELPPPTGITPRLNAVGWCIKKYELHGLQLNRNVKGTVLFAEPVTGDRKAIIVGTDCCAFGEQITGFHSMRLESAYKYEYSTIRAIDNAKKHYFPCK